MTGQGQGRRQYGSSEITAEVRAVNNRHLKIQTRLGEGLGGLEPKVETVVRSNLRRGSLQLSVQLTGAENVGAYVLQQAVIANYYQQCQSLSVEMGVACDLTVRDLLSLPGVVGEARASSVIDPELEQAVLATVDDALQNLNRMREAEGDSMASELGRQLEKLQSIAEAVQTRAPVVVEEYRTKLSSRLSKALAEVGAKLQEADVVREVLVMADKADIREEVVRLQSHFEQFQGLLTATESQGRKLDFLIQEMFRETNTIGSKAGDAEIAQRVVDMKTVLEQMRELVQNVE